MRWRQGRRSDHIEDRRGQRGFGGGRGSTRRLRLPTGRMGGRSKGISVGFLLLLLVGAFFGLDPAQLLQTAGSGPSINVGNHAQAPARSPQEEQLADFVSVVLADTEDTWRGLFDQMGGTYREPTLVLFTDQVQSNCGVAGAAVGPFYCPADEKVYIDLQFFRELALKLDAPGDFAKAYVLAHEVGHHAQTLMGITGQIDEYRRQVSPTDANRLSVLTELQADCFAGVWAHYANARGLLEAGDMDEAIRAAGAVGDDTLQRRAQGRVVPDSFTHGTAEQRVRWFVQGFNTGDPGACNTFD